MKKTALVFGALSLALSPVAVSALESNQFSRAVAPVERGSEVIGGPTLLLVIGGIAATVTAIAIAASDDDETPISG